MRRRGSRASTRRRLESSEERALKRTVGSRCATGCSDHAIKTTLSGGNMDNLPIIDPHHHLYDLKIGRYPWLQDEMLERVFGDYSAIRRDYLIDDFREDIKNQNVVKTVH